LDDGRETTGLEEVIVFVFADATACAWAVQKDGEFLVGKSCAALTPGNGRMHQAIGSHEASCSAMKK